jgi:hypothetical protein
MPKNKIVVNDKSLSNSKSYLVKILLGKNGVNRCVVKVNSLKILWSNFCVRCQEKRPKIRSLSMINHCPTVKVV